MRIIDRQRTPTRQVRETRARTATSISQQTFHDLPYLAGGSLLYTIAAPPYEWSGAAWFALVPLFLVLRNKTPRAALAAGFVYGVLFCAGIAHWVYFAVAAYFPFGSLLALLVTFLSYGFFVGSYTGLAVAGSSILLRKDRSWLCWAGVPALWVSGEFARTSLFAGFSWELFGCTQYRYLPLVQVADLTGVYGLSFLLVFSNHVVADSLCALGFFQTARCDPHVAGPRFPWRAVGCLLIGLGCVLVYGTIRLQQYAKPSLPPVTVALVWGEGVQPQRWQRVYYASTLLTYITATRRGIEGIQPDLVVWPEFAVGFYLDKEPLLRAQLNRFTQSVHAPLLAGAPRLEETETGTRYYNSAYFVSPGGAPLEFYDKRRLLPFAEYRPLWVPALLPHSAEYPSEFTAGERAPLFSLAKARFGVTICYETTYPSLSRQLVREGAQFLVNISNDSWLTGAGIAAANQHFSLAVFRAIETKRPLARVAAAGVSGFVDPTGRPYQLSTAAEGVLVGQVEPRSEYTIYTRYGDWFAWACVALAVAALIAAWQR